MTTYRYDSEEDRVYHAFGLLSKGDEVEADEPPDSRFTPIDEK